MSLSRRVRSALGFSLVDLLMTVAVSATLMAIAVPAAKDAVDGLRLGMAMRDVERELQTARLRAVSSNRPLRVRFNCPSAGQFRIIEITGVTTTDTAGNRCDPTAYPYPGPRDTSRATPEHDGPVRQLHFTVTMSGPDLQFFSNGTVQQMVTGALQSITTDANVSVTKGPSSKTVKVNGLGKIQIQ